MPRKAHTTKKRTRGHSQPRIGPRKTTSSRLPLPVKVALERESQARGITQARIVAESLARTLGVTP